MSFHTAWFVAGHLQGGSDRVAEALPVGGEIPEPFAAEEGGAVTQWPGGVRVQEFSIWMTFMRFYFLRNERA